MEAHKTPEVNQASGNSIFWALVALALNAMTEPARLGGLFRPRSGPGTTTDSNPGFDPLRSSPVICAAETLLDIFFFFIVDRKPPRILSSTDATPNTPNTTEHRPVDGGQSPDVLPDRATATNDHSEPNIDNTASSMSTLKILAFFLGVLPQVIKLFSMRGIAGTQICAALFFAASVARAISFKSSSHYAASIDILNQIEIYTFPRLLLLLLTMFGHYIFYIWVYFNIAAGLLNDATLAGASHRSVNILIEIALSAKTFYILFGLLTIFFNLAWRKSLPRSKALPMILAVCLPPPRHMVPGTTFTSVQKFNQAIFLLASSLIGCLLVSALCIAGGGVLSRLAAKRAARSGGYSDVSLPTMSTGADAPGWRGRFNVADALRRGHVCLEAVFVGAWKAADNHGEWLGTWHNLFGMSTEQLVLAYGIFNLLTALLYYLVAFDSTGTSSPLWTSALG